MSAGEFNMRLKLLLVTLLVLSNLAWFGMYRTLDQAFAREIGERHRLERDRDFWSDQAGQLNKDILAASRLPLREVTD